MSIAKTRIYRGGEQLCCPACEHLQCGTGDEGQHDGVETSFKCDGCGVMLYTEGLVLTVVSISEVATGRRADNARKCIGAIDPDPEGLKATMADMLQIYNTPTKS